ncbi:MAG: GntR family transcriptional regulator [Rhodospirillales bacterium]
MKPERPAYELRRRGQPAEAAGKIRVPTVRDEVYEQLRERILSSSLPEGTRIDLKELAADLGVSATPLKEAIQRLESEGLLVVQPRRGTFVATIDEEEVREGFDVRKFLELGAAEIVVKTITGAELEALDAILRESEALLGRKSYQAILPRFILLDGLFHERIIGATQHRLLIEHYANVNTLLHVSRIRRRFEREDSLKTVSEHRRILTALKARDEAALKAAIRAHIEGGFGRMSSVLGQAEQGERATSGR